MARTTASQASDRGGVCSRDLDRRGVLSSLRCGHIWFRPQMCVTPFPFVGRSDRWPPDRGKLSSTSGFVIDWRPQAV
jgi:hypothetical protein